METKNKQWTCQSATPTGIHGQLRPEDLSANRNGQNRADDNVNRIDVSANNGKQSPSDILNKKGLDQFLAQQVENSIWSVLMMSFFARFLFCQIINDHFCVLFISNHHVLNVYLTIYLFFSFLCSTAFIILILSLLK